MKTNVAKMRKTRRKKKEHVMIMKGMVNHKGAVMAIGTVTVSSQIKDPSIVFHSLPSCPVKRHSSSFLLA
jgi:anthranilate/para-aminobenzoate synthase component I